MGKNLYAQGEIITPNTEIDAVAGLRKILDEIEDNVSAGGLVLADCQPANGSFRKKEKDISVTNYANDVAGTYSSILLYHENREHFSNVRANGVTVKSGEVLMLSKSATSVERFTSIDELPYGSPTANVYLVSANLQNFKAGWDIVAINYEGTLTMMMASNARLFESEPTVEDFEKGIFYKNDKLFEQGRQGYLNNSGTFVATPLVKWYTSDDILVVEGQRIRGAGYGQLGVTPLVAMYDENGGFMTSPSLFPKTGDGKTAGFEQFDVVIPRGVAFVRVLSYENTSKTFIVEPPKWAVPPSTVVPYKYGHSLRKPYHFKGKTAIFFGDSVTYGVSSNPWTNPLTECYRKIFTDLAGLNARNEAVSGSFIYDPAYSGAALSSSIYSMVSEKITNDNHDFIFIAGGINDFWTGKALGIITDVGNVSFYGALKAICEHIKAVAPSAKVIFITPINYSKIGGATPVAQLNEYRNAIFEVATMNGYSVVDSSVIGFPTNSDNATYKDALIQDGVHPTALGHRMMAEMLYSILGE